MRRLQFLPFALLLIIPAVILWATYCGSPEPMPAPPPDTVKLGRNQVCSYVDSIMAWKPGTTLKLSWQMRMPGGMDVMGILYVAAAQKDAVARGNAAQGRK